MNRKTLRRIYYFVAAWGFALLAGFAYSKMPLWWARPVEWSGGATAVVMFILALGGDEEKK